MPQIRGLFPWPIPQVYEGMNRLVLFSGGVWYPPSGNYFFEMADANSAIEVYDPVETTWRTFIAGSGNGESCACDGANVRVRNTTGSLPVQLITFGGSSVITGAGAGMTNGIGPITGVSLAVSGGTQTAGYPTPTLYAIIGGTVQAPAITRGGSGFLVPPLIVIDPPPVGGIQATAYAVLTAGAISAITMNNPGAGYTSPPNFWIIPQPNYYQGGPPGGPTSTLLAAPNPPPGAIDPANAVPGNQLLDSVNGAKLTPAALTGSGTLTGVAVINPGGGYTATTAPTVTISGGLGAPTITLPALAAVGAVSAIRSQPRVQ